MGPADFDFPLPDALIARHPAEPRDSSRLLHVDRATGDRRHFTFRDLPSLLREGDLLVLNDTKVLPARLYAKDAEGRRFEVLLLTERAPLEWSCLVRPGKKVKAPTSLSWEGGATAYVERVGERGFVIRFEGVKAEAFLPWLDDNGKIPLPPYLKRPAVEADRTTYQTVFARAPGSVAAPTAGLHFTPELLEALSRRGVELTRVTLSIGYGTFAPIQAEDLEDHRMHEESYQVPEETLSSLDCARTQERRVIAVGTTSLRVLESLDEGGSRGSTSLFIRPGHRFRRATGLVTNFHLPQSSLLVLVSAFLGREKTLEAYADAVERGYRFFSYGDAMAVLPP